MERRHGFSENFQARRVRRRQRNKKAVFVGDPNADTEREGLATFHTKQAKEAFSALSPNEQRIMIMHFWQDMSFAEIAQAVEGSTSGTILIYHKALKKLRKAMQI